MYRKCDQISINGFCSCGHNWGVHDTLMICEEKFCQPPVQYTTDSPWQRFKKEFNWFIYKQFYEGV